MPVSLHDIERRFTAWALTEDQIRAAIVVGSQARVDHPADPWSDLDIILFVNNVEAYLSRADWFKSFAPVWVHIENRTVSNEPEHLVLYEGGLQVDFVLDEAKKLLGIQQMLSSGQLPDTIQRGVRVLFDKDHLIPPLPKPRIPPAQPPPTQAAFLQTWERFWFTAVYAAKQLRRGDLTFYKDVEHALKQSLLPFLEWHTRCSRGWDTDTWHNGRFLSEWLDPELTSRLASTYTRLDTSACWQGLQALLDLAQQVIPDTAASLQYTLPVGVSAEIRAYIDSLSQMDP